MDHNIATHIANYLISHRAYVQLEDIYSVLFGLIHGKCRPRAAIELYLCRLDLKSTVFCYIKSQVKAMFFDTLRITSTSWVLNNSIILLCTA